MKSYSKAYSLLIIYPSVLSPHIREYNTGLDSGFYAVDSGFLVLYYGFQIPGFRSLLQTFTAWIQCPTKKNFPNSESGIPYILHGAITHCVNFHFLLLLSSICSPDSICVCIVQYHKIYLLFVQRLSYVLFLFVLTERPRALFAAEAHTYRKWKPIHARKFGYDVGVRPLSVHTDSEGRGKKTR